MTAGLKNEIRVKKVMAGVQSLVTLVAIVVTGAWALYTVWRLGTVNRARAEITALERRSSLVGIG